MDGLPKLPEAFQIAFEVIKAKADQEYSNRGRRFPHQPAYANFRIHLPVLIQSVFFAYCDQARNACSAGYWPLGKTRLATERAWPLICDSYLLRENGALTEVQKAECRSLFWKPTEDDQRWPHHLSELIRLGEAMPSVPKPARKKHSSAIKRVSAANKGRTSEPRFPSRALWLKKCLYGLGWNKNDLAREGGPDRKSTQKVLDGKKVREDVLAKIVGALSKKLPQMKMENVPQS